MHIIGHHNERRRLQATVEGGIISQSYLFSGPESVGKSLCALEFACALAGEPLFEPSEAKPAPFDVSILRPHKEEKRGVTKTKNISAEETREALHFLGRYPVSGRYRVVIIEDAHKLSQTAQNILLKTLEEPNTSSVIILVTHEIGSIVGTVLSRVQTIRFDFVPEHEIATGIIEKDHSIAPFFFSLGRPGMILRALRSPEEFASDKEALTRLFKLSSLTLGERMKLAEELGKNVPQAIRLLEWWLPGLHVQALKGTDFLQTSRFFALLGTVEETLGLLKTTQANARLLLEKLFFAI